MVMRKHQRYFPVYDSAGELLPLFVTVANGAIDVSTVQVCATSFVVPCVYLTHLYQKLGNYSCDDEKLCEI